MTVSDEEWHQRGAAFARALAEARQDAGLEPTEVAAAIGKSAGMIYKYEDPEDTIPRADIAMALEAACDVEPGRLTKLLGYVPAGADCAPSTTVDAIAVDPHLDDQQRGNIILMYRAFTQGRGTETGVR